MIITIGRECGCKGDTVGRALAQKFNIPFYDKKGIKELACLLYTSPSPRDA